MKSLIKFLSIKLFAIFFVFNVNAQEFNALETYSGSINGAYNIANLPLLPGNWKVDDLEKSGSVQSGNFYVYATLVPSDVDEDVRRYNDIITYALLGSKSEETSYRKTFFGCEGGFNAQEGSIVNINTRGSGNFEETCSVIGEINPFYTFFYTDCDEICVEVNFTLHRQNYSISDGDFASASDQIFKAIRNTVNGQGSSDLSQILSNYKS